MKPLERIVVLGGAGNMGRVAVRTAASLDGIREIIIGDRDLAAAEKIAAEAASSPRVRIRAERIDVTDSVALRRLLSEAGAMLNTTGPFHKFGVPILRAAIEARTHYLDICDDWEPTLEMMREHQNATNAGVVAVIGMGASPGVSNLLAKVATRELDEVTDLYTAWPLDVPIGGVSISEDKESLVDQDGKPSAAVRHLMQQISGLIRVVEGGQLVDRRPLEAVEIDYPGRGRGMAYTVGHPEPLTMCATLGIRGRSACLMILTTQALSLLKDLNAALGQKSLTNEQAAAIMIAPGALRTLKAVVKSLSLKGHGDLPPFFAFAAGIKDGKAARVGVSVSTVPKGMANSTGVPLALGLRQLLEGRLATPGVFAPEAVIEPDSFFDQLVPYCDPPVARSSELLNVTIDRGEDAAVKLSSTIENIGA